MSCGQICLREQFPRDPISPGVVRSTELIHRGFFPSDRNKTGVKAAAFRKTDLWQGQLSVWRLLADFSIEDLVQILEPALVRREERFDEIRSGEAGEIRNYQLRGERGFSILDDCVYDAVGNKHRAHAQIAICDRLKAGMNAGTEDPMFLEVREWLKLFFDAAEIEWKRPSFDFGPLQAL